jgi:hypothetical protein
MEVEEVEETDEANEVKEVEEVKEKSVRPNGHWSAVKRGFCGYGEKGVFVASRFCEGVCFLRLTTISNKQVWRLILR